MKATGIVRRIDDLGRIVIPKEIRRTFAIPNNCPLEVFVRDGNYIVLRQLQSKISVGDISHGYVDVLSQHCNALVCIADLDAIAYAAGPGSKKWIGKPTLDGFNVKSFELKYSNIKYGMLYVQQMEESVEEIDPIIHVAVQFLSKRLFQMSSELESIKQPMY